jgi:hypothetical protein
MDRGDRPDRAFADYVDEHWPGGLATLEKGWHSWIRSKAQEQRVRAKTTKPSVPK